MFRAVDLFRPIASLMRERQPVLSVAEEFWRAGSEPDENVGVLIPVYSEIARRLSRNAYTSHGAA